MENPTLKTLALKLSKESLKRIDFGVQWSINETVIWETFSPFFQKHGFWGLRREQLPAWTVSSSIIHKNVFPIDKNKTTTSLVDMG